MRKPIVVKIIALLAAVYVLLSVSCQGAGLGGKDAGALRLVIQGSAQASKALGSKTIDASVTDVELKMTSVPSDLYPPRMASAAFNLAGTTLTLSNIKVGTWKVEVFLNDVSGNQIYYGSDQVQIYSNIQTTATIDVFKTGGLSGTVVEGVPPPYFAPNAPNMVSKTFSMTIAFPSGVSAGSSNYIKYTVGANGAVPLDPDNSSPNGSNNPIPLAVVNFTDTIKARIVMGDLRMSAVQTFSYTRPYFSLAEGSYTGFQNTTLLSMRPGVTIRYTVSDSAPGAEPTYEYGELAGNNSVVALRYPTTVLKAVSYIAGQPDTISDLASATYTLDVAPKIQVYINGGTLIADGAGTLNFGITTPSSSLGSQVVVGNAGNGQDLLLGSPYASISGTDSGKFALSTSGTVQRTIANGDYQVIGLSFSPGGSTGTKTAILHLYSDDPAAGASDFTINLTALSGNAPTVAFLEGLEVKGSTYSSGAYYPVGTLNLYTGYQLKNDATTYIFYSSGYYRIGSNGSWSGLGNATSDMYDVNTKYRKNASPSNPLGKSSYLYDSTDSWGPISGNGTAPWVTRLSGIGGKVSGIANTAYTGFMTTGRVLNVYYSYAGDVGDAEDQSATGTQIKWYKRASGVSSWGDPIKSSSYSDQTYTLTGADISPGTEIKVEVTPKSVAGLVGQAQVSTITVP